MKVIRRNRTVNIIISLVLAILLIAVVIFAIGYNSERYARRQAEYVSNNDVDMIFNNFVPELKNNYHDEQAFYDSDAGLLLVESIQKVKLDAQQEGNFLGGVYRYHLVREDDPEQGYRLLITTTKGLLGKKIQDITIQPIRFLEEQ